jgi:primosomal protein N' (replication factor Y)
LTFHKSKNKLSCHYCGTSYAILTECAACGGHDFEQKKFGTEKIEETVAEMFPNAKVARMDLDTIKGKKDQDNIIQLLEGRKIDILVGTQMVVKGFDFEHVNLVGIVDGDSILNFTDFRVNEKAFQLIEQVSGRAGRRDGNGKLCIQVVNTQHPVLKLISMHDFAGLFQFEIEARRYYHYPPFTRMIKIQIKHVENHIAAEAAILLVKELSQDYKSYITGPAQPAIDRIRNQYIWEIQVRLPKLNSIIRLFKRKILEETEKIRMDKNNKRVVFEADVDPL